MKTSRVIYVLLVVCAMVLAHVSAYADQFTIAIMQDETGAGKKYRPLQEYLAGKGIDLSFIAAPSYSAAADMFVSGKVDAMFSGSAIAGMFIMKDLATPLLRPVSREGYSTYWAVIIAPKGSMKFNGKADYFKGKRVILTPLASSGEIFYHSIPNIKSVEATIEKAASHGGAINALSEGHADVAIVKNRVWDNMKSKYPNLILVGEDKKSNPDNTLIISKKANTGLVLKIQAALLNLTGDSSPQAQAVRNEMGIRGFIKTTKADFKHTIELLERTGFDLDFK
jgi:ABC-type phosphate/phosphonate transport system substrate-binding protein